jgi:hypothetical protein
VVSLQVHGALVGLAEDLVVNKHIKHCNKIMKAFIFSHSTSFVLVSTPCIQKTMMTRCW